MFLLNSLTCIPGQYTARVGCVRGLSRDKLGPRPLLLERLEDRLCPSTRSERFRKCHRLIAILAAIVMTAFFPCAYADLYVGSQDGNSVLRYNEVTGALINTFVSSGSGGLSSTTGVIIGPDGNLYVNSFNNGRVLRYDGSTGAPLPAPGKPDAIFVTPGDGGLQSPAGLIFGPDGNLYVSSRGNNSVLRYNGTTGDFLDAFVGLTSPRGLVFGPDGNLYVSNGESNYVMRYDGTTGAPLPAPGNTGAVFASLVGLNPIGLVFGPDGNLYVASHLASRVVRFNGATGEFIDKFVSASGGMSDLVFGPDNNLYVTNYDNNRVLRYDGTSGAPLPAPGQTGATFVPMGSGGLMGPVFLFFSNTDPTTLVYVPAPANRFLIAAPPSAVSGTPFDVTVTALDPYGNIATVYSGTVTFASSDPQASLPANYTFAAGDNGSHTFAGVTLFTAGAQTLTAQDTANGSLTGSATVGTAAAPADHFLIAAPQAAVSAMPFDVTVTALDPYSNIATGYTSTVTFASSDAQATLPGNYTFTADDNGAHTFTGVTLFTAGAQTLTAQDTANGSLTGSATVAVAAGSADHFLVTAPPTAVSGTPFDVMITALDPSGNVDTNYTGTVTWASSDTDPGVILPTDYTFQANDNGTHTFIAGVTLITPGNQSLIATQTASGITGSATVTVTPGPHAPPGEGGRRPRIPSLKAGGSPF